MELGINLSGAAYGLLSTTASVDYFAAQGFSTIRLPLDWEQLQPRLGGQLDNMLIAKLHSFVSYAESQGMHVILDLHNYGAYQDQMIGSASTPVSAFADFWGKLAGEFATDSGVSFGLMNEPQLATAGEWLTAVNAGIAAIRDVGATSQRILVSGTYWDGAWSWMQTDNAAVLGRPGAIVDSSNNHIFEVHQYLDDTSGQHDWVVSQTIGVERLTAITNWARETGAKLYLGEFGVAANALSLTALTNMLNFVEQNADVWQGAAYWAAGLGWHDYMYSIEPNLGILDLPQMAVLKNYTTSHISSSISSNGTIEVNTFVKGRETASIKDVLSNNGEILSRTILDADGHVTRCVTKDAAGHLNVAIYSGSSSQPSTMEIYDVSYTLLSRAAVAADGSKVVTFYGGNEWTLTGTESYSAAGLLTAKQQVVADGGHVLTDFTNGIITKVETYDAAWHFVSRASYDDAGRLTTFQSTSATGENTLAYYNSAGTHLTSSYIYNASWQQTFAKTYDAAGLLQSVQAVLAGGGHQIDTYQAGSKIIKSVIYDTAWTLLSSNVENADGSHSVTTYKGAAVSQLEVYDASWHLVSRTSYDAQGKVAAVLHEVQGGGHQVATYASAGDAHPSTIDTYDASWHIISRAQMDASGHVRAIDHINADGSHTVDAFEPGATLAATRETYDSSWHLISRTSYDAQGKVAAVLHEVQGGGHQVATYASAGDAHPSTIDTYDASWHITSRAQVDASGHVRAIDHINADGSHTVDAFEPGATLAATREFYDGDGCLQSRTTYDGAGLITSVLHEEANGTHVVATYAIAGALHPAIIDNFDTNWDIIDRLYLDESGAIISIDHVNKDGTHQVDLFASGSNKSFQTDTFDFNRTLIKSDSGIVNSLSNTATSLLSEFNQSHDSIHAHESSAIYMIQDHSAYSHALADVFYASWTIE
ncbi:glycoside hydrolase family 5 protein [Methylobacterium sp. CM6247]